MNNIIIYVTQKDKLCGGFLMKEQVDVILTNKIWESLRFPDMKTAIHKADELRKAGYETQTLLIL